MGDYIAFHDDDDLMKPNRILRLCQMFKDYPNIALALGDCAWIDAEGRLTGKRSKFDVEVKEGKPLVIEDGVRAILWPTVDPKPPATLFRKDDGERVGWFDTRFFHGCEDTDFFARIASFGPILYLPEVVSFCRVGHNSLTKQRILMGYSQFLLFEKHLNLTALDKGEMRRRLQFRLLKAMKKIAFCESIGMKRPNSVSDDYLERGHCLLQYRYRLAYAWAISIKFPIRAFLRNLFL
jgi:GT2 family glycosyltransferase